MKLDCNPPTPNGVTRRVSFSVFLIVLEKGERGGLHLPIKVGGIKTPPHHLNAHPVTLCATSAHMLHTLLFTIRKRPRATLIYTTRTPKFPQNRSRWPQDAPRRQQDRPKTPQDRPKTVPRRPKTVPRASQDRPKTAPRRPKTATRRPKTHFSSPVNPYSTPPAHSEDQHSNSPGVGGMSEATTYYEMEQLSQ